MLKITLVHSLIAALPQHVAVAKSLGLHKVGDTLIFRSRCATVFSSWRTSGAEKIWMRILISERFRSAAMRSYCGRFG